jgi:hypothetical protein
MNASNEHLLKLSERLKRRRYHTGVGVILPTIEEWLIGLLFLVNVDATTAYRLVVQMLVKPSLKASYTFSHLIAIEDVTEVLK